MSKVPCRRSFEDERGSYPIEYDGLNMLLVARAVGDLVESYERVAKER